MEDIALAKALIVYWSGTGNTEAMAKAIAEGAGDADLMTVSDAKPEMVSDYEVIAFGCPSMGAEVLEESEMEPFFAAAEAMLGGKKVVLFGSYGWGDGEWMRDWTKRAEVAGATLVEKSLIINETPDADGLEKCRALGRAIQTA